MVVTASVLGASAFVRAFFVHLIDNVAGVEAIALRWIPGWSVEEYLPAKAFRAHGYIVLVRGSENGVAGEDLLRLNGYLVWVLLILTAMMAVGKSHDH